jgi:hypothetical protein
MTIIIRFNTSSSIIDTCLIAQSIVTRRLNQMQWNHISALPNTIDELVPILVQNEHNSIVSIIDYDYPNFRQIRTFLYMSTCLYTGTRVMDQLVTQKKLF